jgi:hypothetical protein
MYAETGINGGHQRRKKHDKKDKKKRRQQRTCVLMRVSTQWQALKGQRDWNICTPTE